MFKNILIPVQAWLLSQKRCVGCGTPLIKGKKDKNNVTCKCKRIYIYEQAKKSYRRALLSEV